MIYLLSPIFIVLLVNSSKIIPLLMETTFNLENVFSSNFAMAVNDARFISGNRIFFNKITVLINEFFVTTSIFNPRFYYYSGDSSIFSPKIVEPIAVLLFPFFVYGILMLLKNNNYLLFKLAGIFALLNYFLSPKNIIFLLPILAIYLFVSISVVPKKFKKILMFYSLFLIARLILI